MTVKTNFVCVTGILEPSRPDMARLTTLRQIAQLKSCIKMEADIDVRLKQRCVIEFLNGEHIAPIELHQRLKNFYGEQTVDISTVRRWVRHVSVAGI
jgi:hypothetical protein